ncbi:MAG: NAD-dependent epimerase/dehydratase family protein [Pirellulaceae bacterium]|nr:NAD-dependent epimerase/dehydratase family protein [Pirellulaceae bacterium]
MSLLIVGCGYVGQRVAQAWLATGQPVAALTRGGDATDRLASMGIRPIVGDWLEQHAAWPLEFQPKSVLVAVPHRPDERYGAQTHALGLANVVTRLPKLDRLVYLSTTGVYHQNQGEWVDESSPTEPTRPGPETAVRAECWLRDRLPTGAATTLRLAGIYGPGRVPLLAKLREQIPIPVASGALNLIHVDDIVTAIARLLQTPLQPLPHQAVPSSLYVLSDGQPVERRQFYLDAASIFHTKMPNFVEPDADTARAARSESNKRINPAKILRELQLVLQHPNHVAGLTAIKAWESGSS